MFDGIIQKKPGDSASKPTTPDAPNHYSYSYGVDLDSTQLNDDNDHIIPCGTAFLRNLSLINGCIHNLICLKWSFHGK